MKLTFWQRAAITAELRQEWYTAMAKVADDRLPLFDALERMARAFGETKQPLSPMVDLLLLRMRGGGGQRRGGGRPTLGTQIRGMVPHDEAMLIHAGQTSGQIGAGLRNAAALVQTKRRLRGEISDALMRPTLYLGLFLAMLVYMGKAVVPKLTQSRAREQWPQMAQLMAVISDHAVLIGCGALGGAAAVVILFGWLGPNWTGKLREKADRHVWPFTLISALYGSSFLITLSAYISTGVPLTDARGTGALQAMAGNSSRYVRAQCEKMIAGLKGGGRAEDVLRTLSLLPPKYHWIVLVYGMSSDTARSYESIASKLVDSVLQFVRKAGALVSNLMLVITAALVAMVLLSIYSVVAGRSL